MEKRKFTNEEKLAIIKKNITINHMIFMIGLL